MNPILRVLEKIKPKPKVAVPAGMALGKSVRT